MDDVREVLRKAESQLAMIRTLYDADLELQRPSPTLRTKVRGFLENQKAALDQLALRVVAATGSDETHVHYPMAPWEAGFEASIDKNMPGVREQRPDVAAVIGRHQPFNVAAIGQLRELLVDEKRQALTPETQPAPDEPAEASAADPGASGGSGPPEAPAAAASPPRPPGLGAGLTGPLYINGVEHDPVTMKPLEPVVEARREHVYVDWRFTLEAGEVSVRGVLQGIQAAVVSAIDEVSAAAGL